MRSAFLTTSPEAENRPKAEAKKAGARAETADVRETGLLGHRRVPPLQTGEKIVFNSPRAIALKLPQVPWWGETILSKRSNPKRQIWVSDCPYIPYHNSLDLDIP